MPTSSLSAHAKAPAHGTSLHQSTTCRSRNLVLCFDGTAAEYEGENTNIVRFFSLLQKNNEQLCYYQPGLGTYSSPGILSPLSRLVTRVLDEGLAWYLDTHVMEGYQFIMQNYCLGDKLFLFGFSRGAYTARALAGMLAKVGLLSKDNLEQIPFAYKMYKRTDIEGVRLSAGFKQTFCRDVTIEFLGVWDTVASVGLITGRTLPFTTSNTAIKHFRHALSLDERRARFRPTLYHHPAPLLSAHVKHSSKRIAPHVGPDDETEENVAIDDGVNFWTRIFRTDKHSNENSLERGSSPEVTPDVRLEDGEQNSSGSKASSTKASSRLSPETKVLEVWFAGDHSDIGGGWDDDQTPHSTSGISLRWMVRQTITCQVGLLFDLAAMLRHKIDEAASPSFFHTVAGPPIDGLERRLDSIDVTQPVHDRLKTTPLWWLLEIIPLPFSYQGENHVWHEFWSAHLGRGRLITTQQPNFHQTVNERMRGSNYRPRARYTPGSEVYVE